ncbi:dehydrodolichyl diphosphate synthase complex subunit DHDDS-like [Chrysoperla carnea]|uniref:dehydrodolichyl diphosphate synthase complex subunit DHDDS-like n=1 Tax=Chrysoperla carnea TaxID=189513 RepID=UPI001D073AE2|nr:dehydrodolichyl diphosphate synthase complex subunit DHDDS-like [Chrysoperla carnea]
MSWILDTPLSWLQNVAIQIIKAGPVPKHVAFIMDGNRRYAVKLNKEKIEGHSQGFHKLAQTLEWCRKIGINEVTVYAFSIENFKRSKEEVDKLLDLAREKFAQLLKEKDKLMKHGVCVRVIGKLSLLPPDIRKSIAEAMLMTKDNNRAYLNVAFAYTAREEITNAVETVITGVKKDLITVDDIDEELLSQCMYLSQSPEPDILIRTSGEIRLSDFLLWQLGGTELHFTNVLWPEFNLWHLLMAVFLYQRKYYSLQAIHTEKLQSEQNANATNIIRRLDFIEGKKNWLTQLETYATISNRKNLSRRIDFFADMKKNRMMQLESYVTN